MIDALTLPAGAMAVRAEACAPGAHHRAAECNTPFPLEAASTDATTPSSIAQKGGTVQASRPDAAKEFETMVVSFMLKDVVKSDLKNVLGEGAGGDFYLSVFTDAVARQIVKAGGIGIEQHIGPKTDD